jgi:hypothetical protein
MCDWRQSVVRIFFRFCETLCNSVANTKKWSNVYALLNAGCDHVSVWRASLGKKVDAATMPLSHN